MPRRNAKSTLDVFFRHIVDLTFQDCPDDFKLKDIGAEEVAFNVDFDSEVRFKDKTVPIEFSDNQLEEVYFYKSELLNTLVTFFHHTNIVKNEIYIENICVSVARILTIMLSMLGTDIDYEVMYIKVSNLVSTLIEGYVFTPPKEHVEDYTDSIKEVIGKTITQEYLEKLAKSQKPN